MGELFERAPADWGDDEIRVGLQQVAERIAYYRAGIEMLTVMAVPLAEERDRRTALARQVDEAIAESVGVVAGAARILRSASQRRRDRRACP